MYRLYIFKSIVLFHNIKKHQIEQIYKEVLIKISFNIPEPGCWWLPPPFNLPGVWRLLVWWQCRPTMHGCYRRHSQHQHGDFKPRSGKPHPVSGLPGDLFHSSALARHGQGRVQVSWWRERVWEYGGKLITLSTQYHVYFYRKDWASFPCQSI